MISMTNKVVLVTGASKGLGAEVVQAFAKLQAKVIINYDKDIEKAQELKKKIAIYNGNCILIKADVSKQSEVANMYMWVKKHVGKIDVLINNAGICDDNLLQLMTEKCWEKVIDTNLKGTFLCCREFSKMMIRQKEGKIINISSLKGEIGCVGQVNYSASKAGIIALTKSLAKELGQFNISVNCICPGFAVTDLNRNNRNKYEMAKKNSVLSIEYTTPDMVNFLLFLSSDYIRGISGQVFNLDSRLL